MNAIDIYWISGSPPSWRVLLALEYKQVGYRSRLLSAAAKEHKQDAFLKLNPRGQVPVIQHGDIVVRESMAILHYLEQQFPEPSLFGDTIEESTSTWQWLMDFEGNLRPHLSSIASIVFRHNTIEKAAELFTALEATQKELAALENVLQQREMILGKRLSAADITLYPGLRWLKRALGQASDNTACQQLLKEIEKSTAFDRWQSVIRSIDHYEKTVPPHWN